MFHAVGFGRLLSCFQSRNRKVTEKTQVAKKTFRFQNDEPGSRLTPLGVT
ncbi:MAG: hypothetical protein LBG58_09270 [Planctomycetaceae bacterium]|nr:hypothetical protein [Planctomycetaceae bacterium]